MPWDGRFFRLDSPGELGPWARAMRKATQVSSGDVAAVLGVAKSQINCWERGDWAPNLGHSIELALAHGYQFYLVRKGTIRGVNVE